MEETQISPRQLDFDGERVIPGKTPIYLIWAHTARYQFARRHLRGRRILDAGCGEGYGARYLAQYVDATIGVDIDPQAAAYAQQRYGQPDLAFMAMDCRRLAFADDSFDFVTSFEVIEHFHAVDDYLSEIHRVMAPSGVFVLSTPNKERTPAGVNPFHDKEYTADEFREVLTRHFPRVECYGQFCTRPLREKLFMDSTRLYMNSVWYRKFIDSLAGLYFRGDRGDMRPADPNWVEKISPGTFEFRKQSVEQGTYLVAVCSKEPA
jgi:SAM-dependent methyltransferase